MRCLGISSTILRHSVSSDGNYLNLLGFLVEMNSLLFSAVEEPAIKISRISVYNLSMCIVVSVSLRLSDELA